MGAHWVSCLFNYICIFKALDVAPVPVCCRRFFYAPSLAEQFLINFIFIKALWGAMASYVDPPARTPLLRWVFGQIVNQLSAGSDHELTVCNSHKLARFEEYLKCTECSEMENAPTSWLKGN